MRKVPDCGPKSAAGRARIVVVVAEQIVQEIARAAQRIGVLRAAIILRQRGQNRAALVFAIGAAEAAAAQPLQAGGDLVEIGPHLLDLVVDRTALRRLAGEQREKPGTVAAHALGLQRDAIELGLLLGRGILVAADLVVLGRVAAPPRSMVANCASSRGHIGLTGAPVPRPPCGGGGAGGFICAEASTLSAPAPISAAPAKIHREKGVITFQAYPAIEGFRAGSRYRRRGQRGLHSCFSGQRHVVSGAPVWRGDSVAAGRLQRWQVIATYSLQPAWAQFPPALGTEPVISSGSTRR